MRYTLFIEYIVYLRFETSQLGRPLLQNVEQRANQNKVEGKELEKGAPHKDAASLFGVPKKNIYLTKSKH